MKGQLNNSAIFQALEKWAPKHLAYEWDNVGLQIGSYNRPVKNVMITLDVLDSVVDEAIEKNIDLIIAHHPLLFKPVNEINYDTPIGRIIYKLIKNEITVYATHTNLDIAPGGVNDMLCDQLNIEKRDYIVHKETDKLYKLVVFVPIKYADDVRNAISEAGAGYIGNYSHCTFQTIGKGTFKPREGTNPFIGESDKLEFVDEIKIETIVQESILNNVIQTMINAHPYEEVAYDIIPLANEGESYGLGRIGTLNNELTFQNFIHDVKRAFQLEHVRIVGPLEKKIKNVAIIGGSGEKYIYQAKQKGADVLITGDLTFHPSQEAEQIGLAVIDVGHYIEEIMKSVTKSKLEEVFSNDALQFFISKTNTNPFKFV